MGTGSDNKTRSTAAPDAPEDIAAGDGGTSHSEALSSLGNSDRNADRSASSQAVSGQAHTCCPNCQTLFEVAPELLASNDTRVRCGECLSIFDSLSNLRRDDLLADADEEFLVDEDGNILNADSSYARAMSGEGDDFTASGDYSGAANGIEASRSSTADYADEAMLDVTYSDFDLFSGEAGLPEVAYFDETQDSSGLRFDETEADETLSDTLFSHDLTVEAVRTSVEAESSAETLEHISLDTDVDFVTDDVPRDPLVFKYRDQADEAPVSAFDTGTQSRADKRPKTVVARTPAGESVRTSSSSWAGRSALAFLLIVITVALYGYRSRDALLRNPEVRPWLVNACSIVGCQVPALIDISALKVVKRSVFSHPTVDNALVIDLAFVNEAEFVQPYPVLEIRLTDRNGGLVMQNIVEPVDYLDVWQSSDLLAVGERLDLSLTVDDPGQTATSFELKFR